MLAAVLSGFAFSSVTPWIQRIGRGATGWIIALLPLSLFSYFISQARSIAEGNILAVSYAWVPSLNVNLSFYLDGLSLIFALLITGIGALVFIYTGGYLAGHSEIGRFYAFTLIFMASMLGLVLADNIITLFIFWELTTFSSYLLIGFNHNEASVRAASLQALLVTSAGGLAMLAGLLLLGQVGGSLELSALVEQGSLIQADALYLPILLLILAGAFTKSAQFPFHFWLPNAMAAPTPASAYLHSATMVKAGIYLMARLSPVLSGTLAWTAIVCGAGALTMFVGAFLAWQQTDLKRVLAFSTVSALGILTLLLGYGSELAAEAMVIFLISHALYKGALFLVTGAIDHESGTRDITLLSGLRRAMPITATAAILAGLSMASLPPFLGFIGKELLYEATLESHGLEIALISVAVLANMFYVAAAGIAVLRPFSGPLSHQTPKHAHEAPISMWLGPLLLAGLGLTMGLLPQVLNGVTAAAVQSISTHTAEIHLRLWHGFSLVLGLSMVTLAGGVGLYLGRDRLYVTATRIANLGRNGPARWYDWGLEGLNWLTRAQTMLVQHGYLRYYTLTLVGVLVVLVGLTLLSRTDVAPISPLQTTFSDVRFYEVGLSILILLAAIQAVRASSRLAAIAALGVVGYGIALIFVLFGAPDLAMTQFAVETLTVIIFVLVLYRLPPYFSFTRKSERWRDAIVAVSAGTLLTVLILIAQNVQFQETISGYYVENSVPEAHGHNIVNVILVDFRGLDTLGEITVLALAGIGVYGLLKLRLEEQKATVQEDRHEAP